MPKRDEQYNIHLTDNTVGSCSPTAHMLNVISRFLPPPLKTLDFPRIYVSTKTAAHLNEKARQEPNSYTLERLLRTVWKESAVQYIGASMKYTIYNIYFIILYFI